MALAQQPRLLLLDEPTSHLDIKYQIEVLELVRRLNRETGVTVIAAMHDLNLAARYFPRLLLFQRGIVADGGPAEVLEPRLLQRVYGVAVQVGVMPGAEHLSVLPPGDPVSSEEGREEPIRIHVMAGGGSGGLVMRALADAGLSFSAGVLNIGDSDYTLALRLAAEVIAEQPFAPISEAACLRLRRCLRTVSLLILCPMPVGPGNLVLLQEALAVCRRGIPVLLLLSPDGPGMAATQDLSPEVLARLLNTDRKSTRLNSSHTVIYTLSLHDALPICLPARYTGASAAFSRRTRHGSNTRSLAGGSGPPFEHRSEEHTSELQSHSDLHSFPTRRSSDLFAGEVYRCFCCFLPTDPAWQQHKISRRRFWPAF